MLEWYLHGLCTFPNMVTSENIARKQKNCIEMVLTIVDNVGVGCTWSVRISKYGRCGYAKLKIAIK
jgi:hypothetical protein